MRRLIPPALLVLCLSATACNQTFDDHPDRRPKLYKQDTSPTAKPVPPLNIPVPQAELPIDGETNLEKLSPKELRSAVANFAGEQQWELCARYHYWLCQQVKERRYDLACYYTRAGKNEIALYWLQVAALEDGVDPDWADQDEDLTALRRDGRWSDMNPFLRACAAYWAANGKGRTTVVLPTTYKEGEPITTLVWLHKDAATPEDLVNEYRVRKLADTMKVVFVGVSGTHIRGRGLYAWSGNPALDHNRVKTALKQVDDQFVVKPGGLILVGFSQGAQVALEMAVRHPDEFAGAIAFSPGGESQLEQVTPPELLAKRGFVITYGDSEREGNIKLADDDVGWLHRSKAKVLPKRYKDTSRHQMPVDFDKRLPDWVRFVEQAG